MKVIEILEGMRGQNFGSTAVEFTRKRLKKAGLIGHTPLSSSSFTCRLKPFSINHDDPHVCAKRKNILSSANLFFIRNLP